MTGTKVYLDGIQLNDTPIGLNSFEIEVVREDGFASADQILRDKTSTELEFQGDGYIRLCNAKKENFCGIVLIEIEVLCGGNYENIFTGIIPLTKVEFNITKCIAKTQIRDSSFTGRIKDYTKTELSLYINRTKNCERLSPVNKSILFGATSVTSFDVLDLFKYFVNFITDNEITVVSDYLTENPLAITTGYNLHNTTGALTDVFPKITFNDLFTEIRKKTRIFMGIEYDSYGEAYLRIENENYFYTSDKLLTFDNVPYNLIERTDTSRIFNSIDIGSEKTTLKSDADGFEGGYVPDPYNPTDLNETWTKQTFTTCGQCTSESNSEQNKLDLVSGYVIDTDIIYEALNALPTTASNKYENDSAIFLFEYTKSPDTANYTLDPTTSVYIYNANLRNTQVVTNWFGYTPQCITLKNSTENYFLVERSFAEMAISPLEKMCLPVSIPPLKSYGEADFDSNVLYTATNVLFDNSNNILNDGITTHGFTFVAPLDGSYVFKESFTIYYQGSNDTDPTYRPFFAILDASNTVVNTVYGDEYTTTTINEVVSISFTSPVVTLFAGYSVKAGCSVCRAGTVDPTFDYYIIENQRWELLQDVSGCDTTQDDTDSKNIEIEFNTALCYNDLKTIRNNKRGYIDINNKPFWIKSIKWRENDLTEFILIGNDSFCSC